MMKKLTCLALALMLSLGLTACGGGSDNTAAFSTDLTAFYDTLFQGEDAPAMMELTDDLLDSVYPGLNQVALKQCVVYTPMISAVAAEAAMVEVADQADVQTVRDIFQARIDSQVDGGAWYPETIEQWEQNSEIVVRDNYICLFVGTDKDEMVSAFNAL
jgi:hypothetical protein